ncbi:MAG: ribonuclease III [Bacteroidaceae bacterium]
MKILDEIRLLFKTNRESYRRFYTILGFLPHDIELYQLALQHKSIRKKDDEDNVANNERMEFLGDAVIDTVVAAVLYDYFPNEREGSLTSTRSKIVQRETLDKLAVSLGLDKLLVYRCSRKDKFSHINGNALEAFVGAIYLDKGFKYCDFFIRQHMIAPFINLDEMASRVVNFKSKLIEWAQRRQMELSFELIEQKMDKKGGSLFGSSVQVEGISVANGVGHSKKESQQRAAQDALNQIKGNAELLQRFVDNRNVRLENSI